MKINKKVLVIITLCAAVTVVTTAAKTASPPPDEHYTNLQVLPKDISAKDLNKIMVDEFEDGLGVACNFCHTQKSGTDNLELDFAADTKPEKQIARAMMRMTLGLNKKYLKIKHPLIGSPEMIVTCETCHRGEAFPEGGPK